LAVHSVIACDPVDGMARRAPDGRWARLGRSGEYPKI
jgi:hypothetical protein